MSQKNLSLFLLLCYSISDVFTFSSMTVYCLNINQDHIFREIALIESLALDIFVEIFVKHSFAWFFGLSERVWARCFEWVWKEKSRLWFVPGSVNHRYLLCFQQFCFVFEKFLRDEIWIGQICLRLRQSETRRGQQKVSFAILKDFSCFI